MKDTLTKFLKENAHIAPKHETLEPKMSFNHGFSNLNSCPSAFLFVFIFYYTNKINHTLSFMFPRFLKTFKLMTLMHASLFCMRMTLHPLLGGKLRY